MVLAGMFYLSWQISLVALALLYRTQFAPQASAAPGQPG